ncbi:S-adenosyl-L-methionine-dependent methyltransferase [Xylariomycetidae sp. FL2044]|nr:S-adenosyl-L-methionine-dependent methyltransferase [Xylariomycetidae sp. FL2044]
MYSQPWAVKLSSQISGLLDSNWAWIGIRQPVNSSGGSISTDLDSSSSSSTTPVSFAGRTNPKEDNSNNDNLPVRILDYACGPGAHSPVLLRRADQVRGVDIAETMVQAYNDGARGAGVSEARIRAVRGNLLDVRGAGTGVGAVGDVDAHDADAHELATSDEFRDFDAALISMALHHTEDPGLLLSRLAGRLREGGVLVVVEWLRESKSKNKSVEDGVGVGDDEVAAGAGAGGGGVKGVGGGGSEVMKTIGKKGNSFSEAEMRELLTAAGCAPESVGLRLCREVSRIPEEVSKAPGGFEGRIFVAKGRKVRGGGTDAP